VETIDVEASIGFRYYCEDYLADLLATKVSEIQGMPPWMFIAPSLLPAARRFYQSGLFLCRVLDEGNFGYCQAAFIANPPQSVDINVGMTWADKKFKVTGSQENKVRFLSPKAARETFQKDTEANGGKWTDIEHYVTQIIDKLYGERIFICCADAVNTAALHEVLKIESDIDLKVRFHAPQ
jgi:hypothetical protein